MQDGDVNLLYNCLTKMYLRNGRGRDRSDRAAAGSTAEAMTENQKCPRMKSFCSDARDKKGTHNQSKG